MTRWTAIVISLLLSLVADAQQPTFTRPSAEPAPNDRLHVSTQGDVRVTTAVPSADEARDVFGVNLYRQNLQPVWIKIENLGDVDLWFLPTGLDSAYFTPIETSYRLQNRIPLLNLNPEMNREVYGRSMGLRIEPGGQRSGYIFSRVDLGTKSFNVDVMSSTDHFKMSFFVPVPGLRVDHYAVDWRTLYSDEEIREVSLDELYAELAQLPCCVTNKKGDKKGDPLNIVIIGDLQKNERFNTNS